MDLDRDPIRFGALRAGYWQVAFDVDGDGGIDWNIRVDGVNNPEGLYTYYYNPTQTLDFSLSDPVGAGYIRENGNAIEIQVPFTALQAGISDDIFADTPLRMFCFTSTTDDLTLYDTSVGSASMAAAFGLSGTTTPGTSGGRGFVYDTRDSAPYSTNGTWNTGETLTVNGEGWPPSTSSYYNSSVRNIRVENASSTVMWTGTVTTDASGNLSSASTWTIDASAVSGTYTIVVEDPRSAGTWYDYDTFTLNQLLEPEMDVQGNSTSIADGDATPDAADDTEFGNVDVTTQAVSHTFTIANNGGAALNLTDPSPYVTISGTHAADFTLTANPSTPIALGGGTTTFTVEFDPSAVGVRTATISIANDDSDENPYNFDIQGTGVVVPEMDVQGNGSSIADGDNTPDASDDTEYGDVDTGSNLSHTFTIINSGSAALNLTDPSPYVTISGTHAADFTLTANPSTPVASGGGTTTFTVQFSPSATGLRTATISVANDDSDENPYNFDIQGTGTVPQTPYSGSPIPVPTRVEAEDYDIGGEGVAYHDNDTDNSGGRYRTDDVDVEVCGEGGYNVGWTNAGEWLEYTIDVASTGLYDIDVRVAAQAAAGTFQISVGGVDKTGNQTAPVTGGWQTYTTVTISGVSLNSGQQILRFNMLSANFNVNYMDFILLTPEMDVQGNGTSIVDGDGSPAVADDTDFGNTNVAGGTVSHTFTILNSGGGPLNLTDASPYVTIGGTHASDFTLTANPSTPIASGGGTTTFTVEFDPSSAGLRSATISIANNDTDENPYNYSIQGTGLAPEMDVQGNGTSIVDGDATPDAADDTEFGTLDVSSGTVSHTFIIINSGSAALNLTDPSPYVTIGGTHAADFTLTANPTTPIASGGGTTTFTVEFDPSVTGLRTATISIANNDLNENPYNFSIQGTGATLPEMDVQGNGTSIADGDVTPDVSDDTDFGGVNVVSGIASHTFTIYNSGSANLTLSDVPAVVISGAHATDFTVTAQPTSPVAAGGGSTTFTVKFDPSNSGLRTATVSIANTDGNENPYNFDIQGTGSGNGEMAVTGNTIEIADGDNTPAAADGTDFGNVDIGGSTTSQSFWIENNGTGDLNLTGTPKVMISGAHAADFTVTLQPSSPLSPGSSVEFTVEFDPSATGLRSATISIDNDDGDENPYNYDIQGTGSVAPEIDVQGNSLTIANSDNTPSPTDSTYFGDVDVNSTTVTVTYTIENLGSSSLTLTGTPFVSILGADAADFSVALQPTSPIASGSSVTFEITFDPSMIGLRTASLSITSDDSDETPYTFAIMGNGIGPGAPLACVPNFFHIMDTNGKVTYLDASTNPYTYTTINSAGYRLNAVGYNIEDGLLYGQERDAGIVGDHVVRIDATGTVVVLSATSPIASWKGDCDLSGNLYFVSGPGTQYAVYDISADVMSAAMPISGTAYAALDIAYMAADGIFYGVSNKNLHWFDPTTGSAGTRVVTGKLADDYDAAINNGSWGASWTANDGYLYVGNNLSGRLYKVNRTTGVSVYIGTGTGNLSVNDGASCPLAAAPMPNSGTISNFVWIDYNNNGLQDAGELGLSGVTVSIYESDDTFLNSTTTAADGSYKFQNLSPSEYYLVFSNLPAGFSFATQDVGGNDAIDSDANPAAGPNFGRTANITISVGVIADEWDAGVITTGIGDYVWDDTDQDGIQDAGESGVPGVTVQLYSVALVAVVQTTTTDANGVYLFGGAAPGNYRVNFINLPGGYVFSPQDAGGNDLIDSDVLTGQSYTGVYALVLNNFNATADAGMYQLTSPEMDVQGLGIPITDGDATPDVLDDTDFDSTLVSSGTVVHTFTIYNTGPANLTLNGTPTVAISGAHASDFTVNVQPATNVTTGSNTTFQVTFDPSAGGLRQASVSIINNDPDENPYSFDIQGVGLAPEMDVQGNSTSIADGDATPDVSDHTDFGNADISTGSVIRTYTIENTGDADLNLTDTPIVQITGTHAADFTVNQQPVSSTVSSGGGTVTFQVTFNPSAAGLRSAAITIANTDSDENPYNFSIQGTGTAAAEMDMQGLGNSISDGDVTPSIGDDTEFGSADIATGTAVHTFTIYNTGSDDLNLTGVPVIEIGGANAGDYLVSQQPASNTVGSGGGSVTFEITFNPTLEGLRQATISIANDDSNENPYNFAIQGTGTATPEMDVQGNKVSIVNGDVTPDASDFTEFGNTELSGPAITRIFKIHSIGSDTLNLTGASPYVVISGTHAADFSVTVTPSNVIESGDSTTFQITFDPSATGTRSATVSIANDDADENPYTFAIQGTGDPDPAPLLVLVKGVDKANAAPGDTLTYTVNYSNAGTANATTIIILDQIPVNTTYVESSATGSGMTLLFSHDGGGSYNASQTAPVTHLQFQRGALLAPGGSGSILFKVTIN